MHIDMVCKPRRGHSWLLGHEGFSWCVLMRLVVYAGLCVGLGAVCGPWPEQEGQWEVLERRMRVPRWFLDVSGRPWRVFRLSLRVPGASQEVLGRPLRVRRGFLGVLGRSLGVPWGFAVPIVSLEVLGVLGHPWGFLELVAFFCWEVNLVFV